MQQESTLLWATLCQCTARAGRVSHLSMQEITERASVAVDAVFTGIRELLTIGALLPLTDDEVVEISEGRGTSGVVAIVEDVDCTYFRVEPPERLKHGWLAKREALRRRHDALTLAPDSAFQSEPWKVLLDVGVDYPTLVGSLAYDLSERDISWLGSRSDEALARHWKALRGDSQLERIRIAAVLADRAARQYGLERRDLIRAFIARKGVEPFEIPELEVLKRAMSELAELIRAIPSSQLSRELQTREPIPEEVRHEVWRRDQGKCVRCGGVERLEFDHIVPVALGGSNTTRNVQLLCETCNREKGVRI